MRREIQITSRCDSLTFDEIGVERCLRILDGLDEFHIPDGELSVVFLSDDEMGELHGTFLGDPSPTDVITFPGDPEFEEAGEICVGVERARDVHEENASSLAEEIILYLAHGWLHLAGYDDQSEEDRKAMRKAEADAMDHLRPVFSDLEFAFRG
ncbi:MAG: rRNA maturation RNase YbeY [Verrucomicrobiota bacterium]